MKQVNVHAPASISNLGPGFDVLPLKIYSMVKLGVKPEVNALCTLLVGFTLLVVVTAQTALRKKQ